jgi:hypothetical protein
VKAGDTFLVSLAADEHLWMIISEPAADPERVLVVNFSTWKPYHDQACVLNPGDHPFLTRRTCVNYPEARVASDAILEKLLAAKQIFPRQPLPAALLQQIREGARRSGMKLEYVQILIDQGLIE